MKNKYEEKTNDFGVRLGDIFSTSWGYEQTNVNFFQVIALIGKKSVRVREVNPKIIKEEATCGMAVNRTYKITNEILPYTDYSVFIENQEKGDLKRLKFGRYKSEEEAKKNCYFTLENYANAYKCNGDETTEYESWYA